MPLMHQNMQTHPALAGLNNTMANRQSIIPRPTLMDEKIIPKLPGIYRDYAKEPTANRPEDGELIAAASKEHSFPTKLHKMLSDDEHKEFICWLPHGRSWKVLKQHGFEEKVIPLFFRHAKLASFMRQVNGWGFRRTPAGPDQNAYYHEMFLRGNPNLCAKMRRPMNKIRSSSEPRSHPNFHDSRAFAPLPKHESRGRSVSNLPIDCNSSYALGAAANGSQQVLSNLNQGRLDESPIGPDEGSDLDNSEASDQEGG